LSVGSATTNASGVATLANVSLAGLNAGTYTSYVTADWPGDTTHPATSAVADLTVNPAALTITADNQFMVYGAPLPPLTASYSGFVNGDTPASLTTAPALSTTATATSPPGTYAITVGGAVDPNYTISYASGTLTIAPAPVTVRLASSANLSIVGQSVTFTATVSPPYAGTPTGAVQFLIDNVPFGALVALSGSITTPSLGTGTHTVTATYYSADANFSNGVSMPLTQTVTASAQQLITQLIGQLNALVSADVLNGGNGSALIAKLNAALNSLSAADLVASVNPLNAFINQVNAFKQSCKLSSTGAQPLITTANQAIAAASETTPVRLECRRRPF
jgi:hypothetical protein